MFSLQVSPCKWPCENASYYSNKINIFWHGEWKFKSQFLLYSQKDLFSLKFIGKILNE